MSHKELSLHQEQRETLKKRKPARSRGTVGKRRCNADCRDVSVFNIKVINNTKGRARPAAVKGQGGVGKTKNRFFFFFRSFYCAVAFPNDVLLTAAVVGGFTPRSKWR